MLRKNLWKFCLLVFLIFVLFCKNTNALAGETYICNVGTTDGLLYPNEWHFRIYKKCPGLATAAGCKNSEMVYGYSFSYSTIEICPSTGCTGNDWGGTFGTPINRSYSSKEAVIKALLNNAAFENVYADSSGGIAGVYTNQSLINAFKNSINPCPKYIYVGSSKAKKKIGFIFSSKKLENAKELLETAGFDVRFEKDGDDLAELAKTNFENHLKEMEAKLQEYKDGDWGNNYNSKCDIIMYFGGRTIKENTTILYYEKYKQDLFIANPNYDFSKGESILEEYNTVKCAPEPPTDYIDIEEVEYGKVTCESLFTENVNGVTQYNSTHKLLSSTLRFVQYLGIVLALVLSIVDFLKVIPTQDKDALRKVSMKAVTRLAIAIVIFFVPIILDFILELIGFNNPTCGLL